MRVRRTVTWLLALLLAFGSIGAFAQTASAAPAEQQCRTATWEYDPGKTPEGFQAEATDGCNTYAWTGSVGQGPGRGTVRFKTTSLVDPWEDNGLPSMAGGPASYCRARAAHEANLMFHFGFKVPDGTEVTVAYSCD